jgi:uncharacterized UBP type Zn finger protein
MLKHVIGKDHADFKTGQQQDAAQCLQHYLEQLDRAEKARHHANKTWNSTNSEQFYPSSHLVSFATETRSVCTADQKSKYEGWYVLPSKTGKGVMPSLFMSRNHDRSTSTACLGG